MQLHDVLKFNAVSHLKEVASSYQAITFPSMIDGQPALHATAVEDLIFSCDMQQHTTDNVGNEGLAMIEDSELVQVASQPKKRRRLQNVLAPLLVEDVQAEEVPPLMCAKMLSKSIGRAKTISTFINKTGPRLQHDSFAVSVHDVLASGPNELTIDLKPRLMGNSNSSCAMILSSVNLGQSFAYAIENFHGWQHCSGKVEIQYSLPLDNHRKEDVHSAMSRLLHENAVPGESGVVEERCDSALWRQMLDSGYVEIDADGQGVRLTKKGMQEYSVATLHNVRKPLFGIREHLALEDMTSLELASMLHKNGWQWALMPLKIPDRQNMFYVKDDPQSPKRFYTLGNTLLKEYLRCLLDADALQTKFQICRIPHYCVRPTKDYKLMLEGKPITPQVNVQQQALRMEGESLELDDVAGDGGDEQLQVAQLEDLSLEDALALEIDEHLAAEEAQRAAEDGLSVAVPDVLVPDAVEAVQDVATIQDVVQDAPMERPPPRQRRRGKLPIIPWGCAEIAERVEIGQDGSRHLAYEARCKHHKYSEVIETQ